MTQGHLRAGQTILLFTILTNDGQQHTVASGLAMIQSAKEGKGEVSSTASTIAISDAAEILSLTVPESRLILSVPKGHLSPAPNPLGAAANPRYFYFEDKQRRLILSGWFEPAQAFLGVKKH
jgi:hypothetical protein